MTEFNYGVEVGLRQREDFLKVAETLTRIGIKEKGKTLSQTCHILHKKGKYYIVHFKELYMLDGKCRNPITESDLQRRDYIAYLLSQWNLLSLATPMEEPEKDRWLRVVKFSEKNDWTFKPNYMIGNTK